MMMMITRMIKNPNRNQIKMIIHLFLSESDINGSSQNKFRLNSYIWRNSFKIGKGFFGLL